MASASKQQGLILTLEGAPNTPHLVTGVPGLYRPNIPTPIGEVMTLAEAKRISDDESIPLDLVEVKNESAARDAASEALAASRNVQRALRRAKGNEGAQLQDEIDATKGA